MARAFPRFLFSDPQNTKSKGPFIIHTLPPRIIFRLDVLLSVKGEKYFILELLDEIESAEQGWLFSTVELNASEWLKKQIAIKAIVL